jgi:hypothetical protein
MPLEREVLPVRPEARDKFLCASWVAKAAHATLAFSRWLVAVLCTVAQTGGHFDKHVLHVRKFRDLRFCRLIAARLIDDDLARHRVERSTRLKNLLAAAFVAPFLLQDVELDAMLVYRTPQQIPLATRDEHLVKVPCATWLAARRFDSIVFWMAPAILTSAVEVGPIFGVFLSGWVLEFRVQVRWICWHRALIQLA